MTTRAAAPAKLGVKARKVWTETVATYELRADELRILEDACREIDLVERIDKELRDEPLMVKGSMGQLVASPLVQELRQHRAVVARLFAALKLPDDGAGVPAGELSARNRAAANARWSRQRGA